MVYKHLSFIPAECDVVPGRDQGCSDRRPQQRHQIVTMESRGEKALHLADILPTHAHANPLWVMAYDNYPLDSIAMKEK